MAWGSPQVGPGGAETTALPLQIRHLYFYFFSFKSQLPNCSVFYSYGGAGLSLLRYGTAQPQLYKSPAQSPAVMLPAPRLLQHHRGWFWGPHNPPPPPLWDQCRARDRQCSCSESPFLLGTSPT